MGQLVRARDPFMFYTRLNLSELTGLRASNLGQLLELMKTVPGSSIYHHTHRFLQQHQYLSPEPPNDFAYWIAGVLGEDELGEMLESIDTIQYSTIRALREKIITIIAEYMEENPMSKLRFAQEGEEFHFIKSVSFIISTGHVANDLREFADILNHVTVDSIYFHIFEARLRLEKGTNDFSNWIEESIGDHDLTARVSKLDPYTHTLEGLRKKIIKLVEKRISD